MDRALGEFLADNGLSETPDLSAIHDTDRVRALLVEAARERRAMSYSEILGRLGFRFTRPKMRALCKTLDTVDAEGKARSEAPLAVLVVRESDGLPGQGWWISRRDFKGEWTGAKAKRYVEKLQAETFDFWASH